MPDELFYLAKVHEYSVFAWRIPEQLSIDQVACAIGEGQIHRLNFVRMVSDTIELRGHIIDSLTLPKVLDQIVTRGATFNIVEFKIGQKRVDPSFARIEITAPTKAQLDELIQRLREQGAEVNRPDLGNK